jgi:hypothetical protein
VLSLRTRGPRAIRSARPQRAKLTPASVTPANASDFETTPRGPDPPRMWLGRARARVTPVSRRLGGPAPRAPAFAFAPLRPWIRPRASAGSSLSRSASLCRARQPSLRKARARFSRASETGCGALGRRDRESRFLTAFFVFPGKFFTVRRLKKRLEYKYQSRVPIKIPQRDRNPRNDVSRSSRAAAFCFLCNICLLPSYEYIMSDVLRDVKVYHDTLCSYGIVRP